MQSTCLDLKRGREALPAVYCVKHIDLGINPVVYLAGYWKTTKAAYCSREQFWPYPGNVHS